MKKVLPIISILLFFLIGTSCHSDNPYQWQGRDKEEMINLFHSNPAPFQELADIFIQNDTFWEKARRDEEAAHAWIMSPNDMEKMQYFTDEEQKIIREFFEKTTPYEVSVNSQRTFTIVYINTEKTDGFTFAYYYGDMSSESYTGQTLYEEWISGQKSSYPDFRELGSNWLFYC